MNNITERILNGELTIDIEEFSHVQELADMFSIDIPDYPCLYLTADNSREIIFKEHSLLDGKIHVSSSKIIR